jgi:DNA-binding NarL/FixJ family response regulator
MIRVLIVGDHEMYRQVMILQLETRLDIEVVGVAGSLSEARTRRLEGVDVAILAHVLPDGVGLELIKELRKASPGVKVLVMHTLEGLAKSQKALEAGADAVLGNLATTDRVLATIRRLKGAQSTAIHQST